MDQPPVKIARSLAEVDSGSIVYVDRSGNVRSRLRARAIRAGLGGVLATCVGVLAYLGWQFGPFYFVVTAGFVGWLGWLGWSLGSLRRFRRAVQLAAAGQSMPSPRRRTRRTAS